MNPDYHKSNGVSALKARNALHDNFLLLMADHLFEPETARMMVRQHLAPGEVILGVDPKLDRIFDIDDATKVRRCGDRIVDIGKEIEEYDAIDTGMFLCTPRCSRISTIPAGTGTVRSPTACAGWHAAGGCARWKSMPPGTTWIRRKRSRMPMRESLLYAA